MLNASHSMIIVASALDPASQRIVRYLSQTHGVAINTAFFTVFEHAREMLLTTDWLLDQQEVAARSDAKVKPLWQGLWYVNVGGGQHRSWEDMRRYGFVSAGRGEKYSGPLHRLNPGDKIAAYNKGFGYVGYGIVTAAPVPVSDFQTPAGPLLSQHLVQPGLSHDPDDPKLMEWAVGVDWEKAVPTADAKHFEGMFANQNVVCRLRGPATIEFLKQEFGVQLD